MASDVCVMEIELKFILRKFPSLSLRFPEFFWEVDEKPIKWCHRDKLDKKIYTSVYIGNLN